MFCPSLKCKWDPKAKKEQNLTCERNEKTIPTLKLFRRGSFGQNKRKGGGLGAVAELPMAQQKALKITKHLGTFLNVKSFKERAD